MVVEPVLGRHDGRAHQVFGLGRLPAGEEVVQQVGIELSGGVLAGLPAENATHRAAQGLPGVVVGTGLHVMALPAVEASVLHEAGHGDVQSVDAGGLVDVEPPGAAHRDAVVVALAVEVGVVHHPVVELLDRIVHRVEAHHLGVADLLVDALPAQGDVKLLGDAVPHHNGAGHGRQKHRRVPFVGLRLEGDEQVPAQPRLKLAERREAFFQVLVHAP